ncbi:GumC family protein [Janthinobacterium sp. MDB2-8]|uniref:GumC family protein n=1 Tax=Janthinobacterium sp. MDB2-8 TaxID=1259338 RepID=UPI003F294046
MQEKMSVTSQVPINNGNSLDNNDDPINLLYPLIVLAKNKKRIIFIPILAALLAAGITLLMPNKYTATVQILPPQSQSGASAMLGQLGVLSGMAGGALGVKNPADVYLGMLSSRTLQDRLIERFKLREIYETKTATDTRKALTAASKIATSKTGLIVLEYEDKNPKFAADLTNAYVEELQKMTQIFAVTEASQRRLFFEKQLQQAKQSLADAEIALKQVQEKTGLIQLDGQAEAIIRSAADFKAQIAAKEVQLGAMRTFATPNNPNYQKLEKELTGLHVQLAKIETGMNRGKGDISVSTSNVPEVGLEYVRRVRDVKYSEAIFEMLAKQFELAKIDEAKEGSILQVMDYAVVPDKKSSPGRMVIVLSVFFLSAFFMVVLAFVREIFISNDVDPEKNIQIKALRDALKWKS